MTTPSNDEALLAECREDHRLLVLSLADLVCMKAALLAVQRNLEAVGQPRDADLDRTLAILAHDKLGTPEDVRIAIAGLQALYENHVCPDCQPKTLTLGRRLLMALGYTAADVGPGPAGGSHVHH